MGARSVWIRGVAGSSPVLPTNFFNHDKTMKTETLITERLVLRPVVREDAPMIEKYVSDCRIANKTLLIPHPYPEGAAAIWIDENLTKPSPGVLFALTLKLGGDLVGVMALRVCDDKLRAETGFWLAPLFWGNGLCTEALQAVVDYGFRELDLQRIYAGHFLENPASGRVQQKVGMKKEGVLRMGAFRFGEPKDLVMYAITRPDWEVRSKMKVRSKNLSCV